MPTRKRRFNSVPPHSMPSKLNRRSSGLLNRGVWVRAPPGALIFRVAQPVERPAVNRMVVGSIPTPGADVGPAGKPDLHCALDRAAEVPVFQTGKVGSTP